MHAELSAQTDPATAGGRYDGVAMALHWLLVLMLVGSFSVGLYMTELPMSPTRLKIYNWHKWAGVTILALSTLRLGWRLTHPPPALPPAIAAAMRGWRQKVFHGTHRLLYLLFFAVPLFGWAYSSALGFPIVWFGVLPLPDFVPVDKALAEVLKLLHVGSAFTLAGLVLLHVAATLKHQFIDRDDLMARMWPARHDGRAS
jgi:cytochrome b561